MRLATADEVIEKLFAAVHEPAIVSASRCAAFELLD
jgi:hypothetical protein